MDTRLTADQAQLHEVVGQLTANLGPTSVAAIDDTQRHERLTTALADTGVRQLRDASDGGDPFASGVEAALVAEALGRGAADCAFVGPLLAGDLARRVGVDLPTVAATVALTPDLADIATAADGVLVDGAVAIDADGAERAVLLASNGSGVSLGLVDLGPPGAGMDLTRPVVEIPPGTVVTETIADAVGDSALDPWRALGLAVTAADAVGTMAGALELTRDYAADRQQYGSPIGSFQAVQHMLAEAHTLMEGSLSISRHASWAADALDPPEALAAAQVATAYVGRAARTVCETAIQVHGGIGHTWECMAHVFLRRALHDDAILGGATRHLANIAAARTGAEHGLS